MRTRLYAWTARIAERIPPVAVREMRSLMRGNRAPGALLVCTGLAVAGGVLLLQAQLDGAALLPEAAAKIGRSLFIGVVLLEAVLAMLLVPILTAGLMAREYDRRAIDELLLTRLTGLEIAWGKLAAGLGLSAVAILCMLPVLVVAFVLGGVSPIELIGSQILILALAAYYGASALCYAAYYRHPAAIMLATWGVTPFTMLFLLPFLFGIYVSFTLTTQGLDCLKAWKVPAWAYYLLGTGYVLFVMLPAMLLLPVLIIAGFFALNPPLALALILFREAAGWLDTFGVFGGFWWLLPFLSAGMLACGAHSMLEDASVAIRQIEGAE